MEKGWNYEYLAFKKEELQKRLKLEDFKQRKLMEEDIEVCDYLTVILLFSYGETIYGKTTIKDFVETIYNQDFSYKILSKELERIEQIALSFSNLPKLKIEQNNTHITPSDSIEIVGDFLKDKFGYSHYKIFKDVFVSSSNYVLFDKNAELSSVTYLDKELFVRIAKSENMEMLSSIAHESGHIYRIVNNDNKTLTNYYGEYESFFYEFNFLLWLIENNIYCEEARNHFLKLFDILEKVSFMRYMIRNYELNTIEDPIAFTKKLNELHMKKMLHIRKNEDLFEIFLAAMSMDLQTYFNSFMATLNHIDNFEKYEQVIKSIAPKNEGYIKSRILTKSRGEFESYLKYRNILQNSK